MCSLKLVYANNAILLSSSIFLGLGYCDRARNKIYVCSYVEFYDMPSITPFFFKKVTFHIHTH